MKAKSMIIALTLALLALPAMAEESGSEYEFKKHAYLQLQGGAQYTLGEAKFGDLISPNVQLGIGWQVLPWFGLRLAANAWQSKGGWSGYLNEAGLSETAKYKYNYVAPNIDLMFSLTNAIGGFNPKRVVDLQIFVGGGANIAWNNDDAAAIAAAGYDMRYLWSGTKVLGLGRAGLALDFRLCDAVSIGIEGNANLLSDHYNSKKAGNVDWYFNLLAGLKFNLGKTYRKKEIPEPVPVRVEEPAPVEQPAPKPEPKPEPVVQKVEPLRRDVFFTINKSVIEEAQEGKVAEIAAYLTEHPDAKVTITGYADAGTGTKAINARLGNERAKAVADALTSKYGIDEGRITYSGKGDTEQPFSENDMNRVSICIAE